MKLMKTISFKENFSVLEKIKFNYLINWDTSGRVDAS